MKSNNFWTTSNIIALASGLMALPVGAAAGLYLLKTNQVPAAAIVDKAPELKQERKEAVQEIEETPKRPELEIEEESVEEDVLVDIVETEEVVVIKETEEEPQVKKWDQYRDESQVKRLVTRIDQATDESELREHRSEIRQALEEAEIVERIHNVTFNSANPHLDHRDETYLVSAMKNSAVLRKFGNHPDAKILVLGYASIDGDRRNNLYALNRAQSAEHSIHEHEEVLGFEATTRSWCIGETDLLSNETDKDCLQHNRAAEIWLVVSKDPVFAEIESDAFLKTKIRESEDCPTHRH